MTKLNQLFSLSFSHPFCVMVGVDLSSVCIISCFMEGVVVSIRKRFEEWAFKKADRWHIASSL